MKIKKKIEKRKTLVSRINYERHMQIFSLRSAVARRSCTGEYFDILWHVSREYILIPDCVN